MLVIKLITIIALSAAIAWFIFEPGFEPAITSIIILAAILKLYWEEVKQGLARTANPSALKPASGSPVGKEALSGDSVSTTIARENTGAYPGGSFTGSDFSGMDMAGYVSKNADYRGVRFVGANLAGAGPISRNRTSKTPISRVQTCRG